MIGCLLGFPEDDWPKLKVWSEGSIVLGGGPRYFDAQGAANAVAFFGAAAELFQREETVPGRRHHDQLDRG